MPPSAGLSCDTTAPSVDGFRRYLEYCHAQAPGAEFSLGGAIGYVYGTARAADVANERSLIQYVLRFANREEDPGKREWFFEAERKRRDAPRQLTPEAEARLAQLGGELLAEKIEAARTKLRRILTSIHENRHQTLGRSEDLLRGIWPLPVLRRKPNTHLALCWVILDVAAFEAFVAVLLLDAERPFGADLCRCRLESCARFFLKQKSTEGLSRTLYCSKEHMEEYHQQRSYARVIKSRAERAKKAARKHK